MKTLTWLEAHSASQTPGRSDGDAAPGGVARGFLADPSLPGWLHDALVFRSISSSIRAGRLIGLPGLELGHAEQQLLIGGGRTVAEKDDQRIHA